jgi:hypothetical protein
MQEPHIEALREAAHEVIYFNRGWAQPDRTTGLAQLADLGLQTLHLGTVLGLKALLVDLKHVNAGTVILFGPFAELCLREAMLARRFR